MPTQQLKDQVLAWLAHGERGVSSEAMACAVVGLKPQQKWAEFGNHPSDPDDFKRCVKFLDAAPEARQSLGEVAKLSKVWLALVENWAELESLFNEEFKSGKAPKLYARMKELGC